MVTVWTKLFDVAIEVLMTQGPVIAILGILLLASMIVIYKLLRIGIKQQNKRIDELTDNQTKQAEEIIKCHQEKIEMGKRIVFLEARVNGLEGENKRLTQSYNQILMELSGKAHRYLKEVANE